MRATALEGEKCEPRYLVFSLEHGAWWRAHTGYTHQHEKAARWSRAEALAICRNALPGWKTDLPPPELPIREDDLIEMLAKPEGTKAMTPDEAAAMADQAMAWLVARHNDFDRLNSALA